ncbi:MAG: hypothetical protein K2N67_02295, partial [Mucispirillum sp.]|nr:hypothetical protein [Mucispirillum sp.]
MKYLYIFILLFLLSLAQGCDDYKSDNGLPLPAIESGGFADTDIVHDTPKLNKPVHFKAKKGNSFSWDILDPNGASVLTGEPRNERELTHTFTKGGEWTVVLRSDIGESRGVINIPNDNADIDYSIDLGEDHSIIADLAANNLYLYGSNAKGKLCVDANIHDRELSPRLLVSFRDLNSVAAGDNHTLFVSSHRAWGCGDNTYGQLGLGNKTSGSAAEPIHITNIKYGSYIMLWVAAGGDKSTAVIRSTQAGSGVSSKVYSFGAEESRDNPTYIPR